MSINTKNENSWDIFDWNRMEGKYDRLWDGKESLIFSQRVDKLYVIVIRVEYSKADREYSVSYTPINLLDYKDKDLEDILEGHFPSLALLQKAYKDEDWIPTMAEIIAKEEYPTFDPSFDRIYDRPDEVIHRLYKEYGIKLTFSIPSDKFLLTLNSVVPKEIIEQALSEWLNRNTNTQLLSIEHLNTSDIMETQNNVSELITTN